MAHAIEVSELVRTFGPRRAVDGVSFCVQPGEVFGLLGTNGAGKTTTTRLLNGVLRPHGGRISVLGLDPSRDGCRLRRQTGVLTETPSLYERLSARENLRVFGELYGVDERSLPGRVDGMLAFFGLSERADDPVAGFSKGMKQRLALARTLVHEPPLLFFDEPTAGLDPEAARQVKDLIAELSRSERRTVVLCSHNLDEAEHLCNRVAIMNQGRLLAEGSVEQLARQLWRSVWVDIRCRTPLADSAVSAVGALP
ncbi:MAG: ABC transporter ATP-binding protein, partial [Deltaproteobacteria bacterium]|nr:ABC transporter ATP-binding protein [Deltaproteobacteria bacterium]